MIEQDQNEIDARLKTLEDKRLAFVYEIDKKKADEKLSKRLIIIVSFFITLGLYYFVFDSIASFMIFYLLVIGLQSNSSVNDNRQLNLYHRIAMETLLKSLYPEISYRGLWNAFKKDVEKSLLLTGNMSGTNHLSGVTKNGYDFECVEIAESVDTSARQFKVVFFKLECPMFFSDSIVILKKSIGTPIGFFDGFKKLDIIKIDPFFASKYNVFAKNTIEAEDLVTLEFLQPLINLSKQYSDISWSFIGNQIYFAANAKTGMFNSIEINNSVLTPNVLGEFHEDIKLCQNISEALGQQIDIISGRLKIGDLDKNPKIKDLEDPYNHLLEE